MSAKKLEPVSNDVVDGETGVVESLVKIDAAQIEKALAQVEKAKESQFVQEENDFWKPTKEGDVLQGVYLGNAKDGKRTYHAVATRHPKTGKPFVRRLLGSHIINREVAKVETPEGKGIRIVYAGQKPGEDGRKLNLYTVAWLAQ